MPTNKVLCERVGPMQWVITTPDGQKHNWWSYGGLVDSAGVVHRSTCEIELPLPEADSPDARTRASTRSTGGRGTRPPGDGDHARAIESGSDAEIVTSCPRCFEEDEE